MKQIPALGVAATRFRLLRDLGHTPATLAEYALETLLSQIATALQPGKPAPTKASLAELVEDAARIAREKAGARPGCPCGHRFGDHLGRAGCLECPCRAPRPGSAPVPSRRRVGDEVLVISPTSRYFKRAGLAVAREGRGLRVQLPGTQDPVHFEQSEIALRPRPALADHTPHRRGK